jgi:hypothetical protein
MIDADDNDGSLIVVDVVEWSNDVVTPAVIFF